MLLLWDSELAAFTDAALLDAHPQHAGNCPSCDPAHDSWADRRTLGRWDALSPAHLLHVVRHRQLHGVDAGWVVEARVPRRRHAPRQPLTPGPRGYEPVAGQCCVLHSVPALQDISTATSSHCWRLSCSRMRLMSLACGATLQIVHADVSSDSSMPTLAAATLQPANIDAQGRCTWYCGMPLGSTCCPGMAAGCRYWYCMPGDRPAMGTACTGGIRTQLRLQRTTNLKTSFHSTLLMCLVLPSSEAHGTQLRTVPAAHLHAGRHVLLLLLMVGKVTVRRQLHTSA